MSRRCIDVNGQLREFWIGCEVVITNLLLLLLLRGVFAWFLSLIWRHNIALHSRVLVSWYIAVIFRWVRNAIHIWSSCIICVQARINTFQLDLELFLVFRECLHIDTPTTWRWFDCGNIISIICHCSWLLLLLLKWLVLLLLLLLRL